jgi:hypothetical protein
MTVTRIHAIFMIIRRISALGFRCDLDVEIKVPGSNPIDLVDFANSPKPQRRLRSYN